MIYDTIPDLTEHVFRSVRGWLHRQFPGLDIYISRKTTPADARPAFRLEMIGGPEVTDADTASGFRRLRCSVQIVYQGLDVFDAQRVAGTLAATTVPPSRIPLTLYNIAYPGGFSVDVADPDAGTLPALVDVAVAIEDAAGNRTAPSNRITVAPGTASLALSLEHWPAGVRAAAFHVYAGLPGESLHLQQSVGGSGVAVAQTTLAGFDDTGPTPPNQASYPLGGLRAESFSSRVPELNEADGFHDVYATVRLCADVPLARSAQVAAALLPPGP